MHNLTPSLTFSVGGIDAKHVLTVLTLGCFILLSGCSAAGSISLDPIENDTDIAVHATRELPSPDSDDDRNIRQTLQMAIETGSGTITNQSSPPFRTDQPVLVDETVYQLNQTPIDQREIPTVLVRVDYNATAADAPTIPYNQLPSADQSALKQLLSETVSDERLQKGYERGRIVTYNSPNESKLVGRDVIVAYEGEQYLVNAKREGTRTLYDYRYEATKIGTASAYGESIREEYVFTLSNLNESQRSVLKEARNGTYWADSTDDTAFASILTRFRSHESVIEGESRGEWIVNWDGETYWARLHYSQFVE